VSKPVGQRLKGEVRFGRGDRMGWIERFDQGFKSGLQRQIAWLGRCRRHPSSTKRRIPGTGGLREVLPRCLPALPNPRS